MAEPRHHTPRSDRRTRGHQVAAIAKAKGRPLMPWQRDAADVALEVYIDEDLSAAAGRAVETYWYSTVLVTVPRQSGKTELEGDVGDHTCLTIPGRPGHPGGQAWITMQTGKDASAWMREKHFVSMGHGPWGPPGRDPGRHRWVADRRAGETGVVWHPPLSSSFRAFAPTEDALHSKQADRVFVDEAWVHGLAAGAALRQAIRPTMATRRRLAHTNPQLWVVSTMGTDDSAYFNGYLDGAIASLGLPSTRTCVIDYGIADDVDPEDLEAIAAAHPAYGHTIDMQTLIDARDEFRKDPRGDDVAGWARAYGNRSTRTVVTTFPGGTWTNAGGDAFDDMPDIIGLGIDLDESDTGPVFAIGAGWTDAADRAHLRVLDTPGPPTRETPAQVAAWARTRGRRHVGYDPRSPGILEITDAIARGHKDIKLEPQSAQQYASACGTVLTRVKAGTLRHATQAVLDEAAAVVVSRPMVDGGIGWHREGSAGAVSALIAPTIALRVHAGLPRQRSFKIHTAGAGTTV